MRHENVERMETCGTVVVTPETVEEMQHLALVNRLEVCRAEPEVTDVQVLLPFPELENLFSSSSAEINQTEGLEHALKEEHLITEPTKYIHGSPPCTLLLKAAP